MAKPRTVEGDAENQRRAKTAFPEAECELEFKLLFNYWLQPYFLFVATDKSVNKATPKLFEAFGTPEKLAEAEIDEIDS